jgi:two-component system, NtrC family, response regulator AtoC
MNKYKTEIILISGLDDIINSINAIDLGILDFLTKPVNIKKLAFLIDQTEENLKKQKVPNKIIFKDNVFLNIDDFAFQADYSIRNNFIGHIGIFSDKLFSIYKKLKKLEEYSKIPVLIEGETGTGKELMAKYIHYENTNNTGEFIGLNCSNLTKELFDSEIFGYEKGAFTGADIKGKEGKIKSAENGTLFLDEITELSLDLQAKLLRVIQEREYFKIGSNKKEKVNTRIVVASNKDIKKLVSRNLFREDLYFRLNICKVTIPPLRERKDEIIPLVIFFIKSLGLELDKKIEKIETSALEMLEEYNWPGNSREMKNLITRCLIFDEGNILTKKLFHTFLFQDSKPADLKKGDLSNFEIPDEPFNIDAFVLDIVKKTLTKFNGKKTSAAKFLGLTRSQLYGRFKI